MKRKRLRYVPGLISLIGIPILLFFFPVNDKQTFNSIRVWLPTNKPLPAAFSRMDIDAYAKTKKLTDIELGTPGYSEKSRNLFYRNEQFSLIRNEMRKLAFLSDTNVALHVNLSDENTLGDIVELQDMADLFHLSRYAFLDRDFYFFANQPFTRGSDIPGAYEGEELYNRIAYPMSRPPDFWELKKRSMMEAWFHLKYLLKGNYPLTAGFILLILLPSMIKSMRSRKSSGSYATIAVRN